MTENNRFPLDPIVFCAALMLILLGLTMVASASIEISARNYDNPFHFVSRHAVYLLISIGAGALAVVTPMKFWQGMGLPLLFVGFGLLIAVLIPGVGREVNGSVRWISMGLFTVQGSEFLKLFVVLYLAGYLVRVGVTEDTDWRSFIKPLAIVMALVFLLMAQPDFGASVVIMGAVIGVIFLAGAPFKYFMPLLLASVSAGMLLATLQPYRLARLTAFTNPWEHQYDGGYQLTQALIAFGRGDLFGLGLGNSIQKLFFLPEAHTDFLYSILAEELGLIGATVVITLFCILLLRALWVGKVAEEQGQHFHAYVAYGASLMLGIQVCINLGVNLGLLPTKGLTLPLMSYGGNSLIVSCLMIGIVLRIELECRTQQRSRTPQRRFRAR
ncbi:MAG: putative lipid II flippase FtsW [Pseudomonadales bacterium]|nr:putative lipid II flippase FtsW [Pseudomonadales bacterium]